MIDTGPLRGIVIHVLPRVRAARARSHEHGFSYTPPRTMGFNLWNRRTEIWQREGVEPGACLWCLRPHNEQSRSGYPRAYHRACKRMKDVFAVGYTPPRPCVCAECGFGTPHDDQYVEIEHKVALSIAYEMAGVDGWVRAMLPGNIRWMCRSCHRVKTAKDRATLYALWAGGRNAEKPEPFVDPNQLTLI